MKIYYAGGFSADKKRKLLGSEGVLNHLETFARIRDKAMEGYTNEKVFLDSGAYSVLTKKSAIDIQKYIEFIKKHKNKIELYANLDVVGDAEGTFANQEIMEKAGLDPLPCFHYGEDLRYLRGYAHKYGYVALGGLVPLSTDIKTLKVWLNRCFSVLMPYIKSKKLKVHAFGISSSEILLNYPFYSCDSSSWLAGARFGRLVLWDRATLKMQEMGHYQDKEIYKKHGLKLEYLDGYQKNIQHTLLQYETMLKDITKIWEARGILWKN